MDAVSENSPRVAFPSCSFFQKDIRGDTDVEGFDAIHVLRLGRY